MLKTDLFEEAVSDGLVRHLAAQVERVSGIDISRVGSAVARARQPELEVVVADVRGLPFAAATFDVVLSTSTLDHFSHRSHIEVALTELHRVLRPDGTLLLTLDNSANPLIALRNALPFQLLHRFGIVPYYVGATLSPRRLRRVLRETGYEVVEMCGLLHCPRMPAVALASALDRWGAAQATRERFCRALAAFEALSRWPSRFVTANFVAVRALKRS